MNAAARAQLTFQMLTLLQKYLFINLFLYQFIVIFNVGVWFCPLHNIVNHPGTSFLPRHNSDIRLILKYATQHKWLHVHSVQPREGIRSPHDDVIKWKHFPRYWPFVRGIHRSPANSPHKGQCSGALMFSLICAWINGWVNNREAGDLRGHLAHYDVSVMHIISVITWVLFHQQWLA